MTNDSQALATPDPSTPSSAARRFGLGRRGRPLAWILLGMLVAGAGVAAWRAHDAGRRGWLFVTAEEPVVVEVFPRGDRERRLALFTAPNAAPLELAPGEYDLRLIGRGRPGDVLTVDVERRVQTIDASLSLWNYGDPFVASRFLLPLESPGGNCLLVLSKEGLELFDGPRRSAEYVQPPNRSTSPAIGESDAFSSRWRLELVDGKAAPGLDRDFFWSAAWGWLQPSVTQREIELYQPRLASEPVDLDGDSWCDIVLSGRDRAWLLAVSGADGRVLWSVVHGGPEAPDEASSLFVDRPYVCADRDGDDVPELLVTLVDLSGYPDERGPQRRVELLSGATGRPLWTFELPADWFKAERPGADGSTGETADSSDGGDGPAALEPWQRRKPLSPIPKKPTAESGVTSFSIAARFVPWGTERAVGFVAGRRVVMLDPDSGARRQEDYELVAPPDLDALSARAVEFGDFDGDGYADVVGRRSAPAPTPSQASPSELSVLVAHSPRLRRVLWRDEAEERSVGSPDGLPLPVDPLVVDLDGDGCDDVVTVLDRHFSRFDREATDVVSVRDGATGRERWRRAVRRAASDGLLAQLLVGPDVNGDGHRELYVATLFGAHDRPRVYALSGATGGELWRQDAPSLPNVDERLAASHYSQVAELTGVSWRQGGVDGWPQLVVVERHVQGHDMDLTASIATCFSAGDGRVVQAAFDVERVVAADLNGDDVEELLGWRSHRATPDVGTWSITQGTARAPWRRSMSKTWSIVPDVNGDEVADLLVESVDATLEMLDGRSGDRIWKQSFGDDDDRHDVGTAVRGFPIPFAPFHRTSAIRRLDASFGERAALADPARLNDHYADVDGDGVADLLRLRRASVGVYYFVSGRTGRFHVLPRSFAERSYDWLGVIDLDGRGRPEWVTCEANGDGTRTLTAWSADLERKLWTFTSPWPAPPVGWGDFDGDGRTDVFTAVTFSDSAEAAWIAADGRTGSVMWRTPRAAPGASGGRVAGDVHFARSSAGIELALVRGDGESDRSVRYELFDMRRGERRWSREIPLDDAGLGFLRHADGDATPLPALGASSSSRHVDWIDASGMHRVDCDMDDAGLSAAESFGMVNGDAREGVDSVFLSSNHFVHRFLVRDVEYGRPWKPVASTRLPHGTEFAKCYADSSEAGALWEAFGPGFRTALRATDGRPAWRLATPNDGTYRDLWLFRTRDGGWSRSQALSSTSNRRPPDWISELTGEWILARQATRGSDAEPTGEPRATSGQGDAIGRAAFARQVSDGRVLDDTWRRWGVDRAPPPSRPPGRDERWARRLPWAEKPKPSAGIARAQFDERPSWRFVRPVVRRTLLSLALVVGPAAFVANSVRRRRFSLRSLLVLPVLVGAALTIGSWSSGRLDCDAWFDELPQVTRELERLAPLEKISAVNWFLAVRYAPPVGLTIVAALALVAHRRRRAARAWLTLAPVALALAAVVIGVVQLRRDAVRNPLEPGEYYVLDDWYLLGWDALILTSWFVVLAWLPWIAVAWGVRRLRARRRSA